MALDKNSQCREKGQTETSLTSSKVPPCKSTDASGDNFSIRDSAGATAIPVLDGAVASLESCSDQVPRFLHPEILLKR